MGVLERAKKVSGISDANADSAACPYVCLDCQEEFEVQYHRCPACGSFDVRCSRWVTD